MRLLALILTLLMMGPAVLPATAAGPYPVKFPTTTTGVDPAARGAPHALDRPGRRTA